jgi:DNA invertase Pin-like site-specific DNA recombinase
MPDAPTPCVIYAAKSTQDKHKSIPDQVKDCLAKAAEEGWEVVGKPFFDENFSAYSGNRGPGLVRAQAAAAAAAAERGVPCMLVAQHSDRFARGAGDRPGASDSLGEIWHRMRRADVHLRSFQNDAMMSKPVLVAVASEQAHEESERKSKSVQDGKRRRAERGESNGSLQFGYRFEDPDAVAKVRVPDPGESAAWLHVRGMLRDGKSLGAMARWLHANGHQSKYGKVIAPQRVKYMLENAFYAGKVPLPGGELVEGVHKPLVSWDEHLEIRSELAALAPAASRRPGRRPKLPSLLSGVMRCAHCGKGVWERKHTEGPWRHYMCAEVRRATGACDSVAFDARTVERAVLDHLDGLFVDLGGWIERLNRDRAEGRRSAEAEAAGMMREREALERDEALVRADYVKRLRAGNEAAAGIAASEVGRIEAERQRLDAALADADARLAEWDGAGGADDVLDWWTEFSDAIRRDVVGAETVAEANAALRERFAAIFVHSPEGGSPRLDFVLARRPPGAPLVSSRLWADAEAPDDGTALVDFVSIDGGGEPAGNNETKTLVAEYPVIAPISL